jgi:hypothetical protein
MNGHGAVSKRFLVTEFDWTKAHQAAACVTHVLDLFLVVAGGTDGAELTVGVDENMNSVV